MTTERAKMYRDRAYYASTEVTKCDLLIRKLNAQKEYYVAQEKYYDKLAQIEDDNEPYQFDLSI